MTHINSTTNSTGNTNGLNTNLNQMSTNRSSDFVNSELLEITLQIHVWFKSNNY